MQDSFKFPKKEKLCGSTLTGKLFSDGDRSIGSFPIRIVWLEGPLDSSGEPVRVLITAPKRHLHEAVRRNRVKRQIREFYRKNSGPLKNLMKLHGRQLMIAFLYSDHNLWDTQRLDQKLQNAMSKLMARLEEKYSTAETAYSSVEPKQ